MTRHIGRGTLVLVAVLVAFPVSLAAQQKKSGKQDHKAPMKPVKPPPLVYRREVFAYPVAGRRNPFHPLVGTSEGGPRFDQLRLEGIIYDSANPSQSVATVGTSVVSMSSDSASASVSKGRAWYLKVGQTIGNIRVVQIGRSQIVVEVEDFGTTTRKIMRLGNRGPEGGTS